MSETNWDKKVFHMDQQTQDGDQKYTNKINRHRFGSTTKSHMPVLTHKRWDLICTVKLLSINSNYYLQVIKKVNKFHILVTKLWKWSHVTGVLLNPSGAPDYSGVWFAQSWVFCIVFCWPFFIFFSPVLLALLPRFTAFDYNFGIFNLFYIFFDLNVWLNHGSLPSQSCIETN